MPSSNVANRASETQTTVDDDDDEWLLGFCEPTGPAALAASSSSFALLNACESLFIEWATCMVSCVLVGWRVFSLAEAVMIVLGLSAEINFEHAFYDQYALPRTRTISETCVAGLEWRACFWCGLSISISG